MKLVSMFCTKAIYLSESILSHNYQKIVNSKLFAEKPILTEEVKSDETFKGSSVVYGEKKRLCLACWSQQDQARMILILCNDRKFLYPQKDPVVYIFMFKTWSWMSLYFSLFQAPDFFGNYVEFECYALDWSRYT